MKAANTFLISFAVAALGAGCADTGGPTNNTARYGVGGAAAGAVAGGIIGNNSHLGTGAGAALGAAAGGIAGAAVGHRHDEREAAIYNGNADTGAVVQAPPPSPTSQPQEAVPPQPSPGTIWIPGHYEYTGAGYAWQPGQWVTPPSQGASWVPPSWQRQANGYVYVRGHWQ